MSSSKSNEIITDNSSVLVIDLITKLQNQNQGNYHQKDRFQNIKQLSNSPFATFYPTKDITGILQTQPDFTTSVIDIVQYLDENPNKFTSIIILSPKGKTNILRTYFKKRIGWVLNQELSIPIFVLQSNYKVKQLFSESSKSLHMGIFIQELPKDEKTNECKWLSFYSLLQSIFSLKVSIYKLTNLPMTTPYSSIHTSEILQRDRNNFYSYINSKESYFDHLVKVKYLLNHNDIRGIAHSIEKDQLSIILTEFPTNNTTRFGYNSNLRSLENLNCDISIACISG